MWGGLSRGEIHLSGSEIRGWITDIHDLQRPARDQRIERKLSIQSLIPGAYSSGHDSAHGERRIKLRRVLLHQCRGDHAS